jgi:selenocysteine-specific elongation factor
LTGVDTDRLKEEKARGISIDLGFAYLPAPDSAVLGFVDVPGHERFIHNMLAGAAGIDFVLLVVAADDGPMPQTREHLAIVELLGIERGLVALTKADLADEARRGEVEDGIRQVLGTTALAKADIVPVSTVSGEGIDALRTMLFEAARSHAVRNDRSRFRMSIDRSFTLPGAGTVVTGTVLSGVVALGERLLVSPSGLPARVRSLHAQNRAAVEGRAGERCALNLSGEGITKDRIARGDVVLDPELHAPADRIDARLRLLEGERKSLGQWTPVRLHHGAAEVGARIVILADEPIAPAAEGYVQLVLERPIASSSAIPRGGARSAAAPSSTCARRHGAGARRRGLPSWPPMPFPSPSKHWRRCSPARRSTPIFRHLPAIAHSAPGRSTGWSTASAS